ncbi:imelysin family protein [Pedobacter gandavensis]|uniref:imelysin family protein n=1 Tax=Pedobacter gandavensis TaxID=2679963 RepID=UPI002931B993|nr:imelysin family protein [Pedobacter gandavensis]
MSLSKITKVFVLIMMFFTLSCGKKGGTPEEVKSVNGFDKSAMLANYADAMIIPAYTQMQQRMGTLQTAMNTFLAAPTLGNQQALKLVFKEVYLQVERVSVLQFGPAESVSLNSFINMLPANTMKKVGVDKPDLTIVEENITSGTYNLVQNSTFHQQGFPVLDYLLFSENAVAKFADAGSANRKKYVQDLMTRITGLVDQTLNSWKSGYRSTFIANTKTDTGSPISFLINQFAFEMDMIKGPRIGWPFGTQSADVPFPDRCEGYYSGISLDLAIENMQSLKSMYTAAGSGKGMSDYVIALGYSQLNTDVTTQFDVVIAKLKAIPAPLSTALVNNKALVTDALKEIQTLLRLIKSDMVSKVGVQISYVDNDGD